MRATGALAVAVARGEREPRGAAARIDRSCRGALRALLVSRDFGAEAGEVAVLYPRGLRSPRLLVVGLGARSTVDPQRIRLAAAAAARRARELRTRTLALVLESFLAPGVDLTGAAQAAAEGVALGHYRHTAYRGDPGAPPLRRIEILADDPDAARAVAAACARGAAWGEAVCLARDLARTPGEDLPPERLAERAGEIGAQGGARVQVLGVPEMERLGMGAVLAVGRGSVRPPRFIVLERDPRGATSPPRRGARTAASRQRGPRVPTVVVIGKGVTFDTGGISLKPAAEMHKMKYDMSGAAAVLGMFAALPTLELPFRIIGLVPAAENMPGGRALKPGDVVRAITGTTIEVQNTDAEGRLLLADALGYAARFEPDAVVDLATLTGAIRLALGDLAAGLFTADEPLAQALLEASARSGERLWRMPLWDEYATLMRSDIADLSNSAGQREGGACTAAAFLARFARPLTWAHLDIASTAWSYADRPHEPRGPTGFGVRLLLEWLAARAAAGAREARSR